MLLTATAQIARVETLLRAAHYRQIASEAWTDADGDALAAAADRHPAGVQS
jgi:hypothetical protein